MDPKIKDRSHDRKMIMYPSFREIWEVFRTKKKGKIPTIKVMMKLMTSGASALSAPSWREISTDSSMNRALTSSAMPTLRDITFRFIACL